MPEHAELRLTADYVNRVAEGKVFTQIKKNPVHKGKEMPIDFPFSIQAKSRGKEILLELSTPDYFATESTMKGKHIIMTMGMGGHFYWAEPGVFVKHGHLRFDSSCGGSLYFVDIRRFGRWDWGFWNPERGPDPVFDHANFIKKIKENLHKREFDRPLYEILMDQKYCNGLGNYIRAEIVERLDDVDPFLPARDIINSSRGGDLFAWCKRIPEEAYILGGGELYTWKNQNTDSKVDSSTTWAEWMKCYGNKSMSTIIDRNKRRFWYDPKWDRN